MEQSIIDRLGAELRARAERGVQKYGVTLDKAQLTTRQVLQHAKEEALDLAAYLERLIDLEDRIAKAPKAWAVKTAAWIEPSAVSPLEEMESFRVWANDNFQDGIKLVRVALVEIPEEK